MIRIATRDDVVQAVAESSSAYAMDDRVELLESSLRAQEQGSTFVVCDDGVIYVLAGITKINKRVAYVWAVTTKNLQNKYIGASKELRNFLDLVQDKERLHRIEVYVRCDLEAAQRWIKFLGFEREGRMCMYNEDGTDSYMYRRIIKWIL